MSEISISSQADLDNERLWSHAIDMEDFDTASHIKAKELSLTEDRELDSWSIVDLAAEQQIACDEWFLGPEGFRAFESPQFVRSVGDIALGSKTRNIWMSSAQLAADKGDYYDF